MSSVSIITDRVCAASECVQDLIESVIKHFESHAELHELALPSMQNSTSLVHERSAAGPAQCERLC